MVLFADGAGNRIALLIVGNQRGRISFRPRTCETSCTPVESPRLPVEHMVGLVFQFHVTLQSRSVRPNKTSHSDWDCNPISRDNSLL